MKLAPILITLLLIGGFITGINSFYGAMMTKYSMADGSPTSTTTLNITNQTYENVESMMGEVGSQNRTVDIGVSILEGPANLIFGAYNAIMLMLKTPSFFLAIFSDLIGIPGIPWWVQTMVYGIVSVIILFAIIEFLTGRATE